MPSSFRRPMLALTAATGGLLAALSSTATANADEWAIGVGDAPAQIISESGMPPFYQDVLEQGTFSVVDRGPVEAEDLYASGLLSSTNMFGMSNEDLVVSSSTDSTTLPAHSVIDVTTMGNVENIYADLAGAGPNGANEITDTLVTPFGSFNIPTTFDAAAFGSTSLPAAATAEAAAASPAAPVDVIGIIGNPGFNFVPDPDDGPVVVTSTAGFAPLYTTVQEQGAFVTDSQLVFGNASFYSDMFGDHSQLFDRFYNGEVTQVIDQFNFGNSGFENIYNDVVGGAPDGSNAITDTFVTPFGDFNIPTLYDAAADIPTPLGAAATDFLGALDADWSTLVTDFSALF